MDLLNEYEEVNTGFVAGALIRGHYQEWADSEGVAHPVSPQRLIAYLESRGLKRNRRNGERGWVGLRWKNASESKARNSPPTRDVFKCRPE